MAGLILMQKIIERYQQRGAWRDADFPLIRLINYPFSDMLSPGYEAKHIQEELIKCLNELSATCDYIIISCQTLHAFLPQNFQIPKLIDLFKVTRFFVGAESLWVAASYTSSQRKLHNQRLHPDCKYLDPNKCQFMIDGLLRGQKVDMQWLENIAKTHSVVLGCTELSIPFHGKPHPFIDPLDLAASHLVELLRP